MHQKAQITGQLTNLKLERQVTTEERWYCLGQIAWGRCWNPDSMKISKTNSAKICNKFLKAKCRLDWQYRSPGSHRHRGNLCLFVVSTPQTLPVFSQERLGVEWESEKVSNMVTPREANSSCIRHYPFGVSPIFPMEQKP